MVCYDFIHDMIIELGDIFYGIEDYVMVKNNNRLHKIYYNNNGDPYINYKGKKIYFSKLIKKDAI